MNAAILLTSVVLALTADAAQRDNNPQTVTRMRDVVRKVDTDTFTGKIEAIDPAKWTITIYGHEIIKYRHHKVEVHEPINKPRRDPPPKKPEVQPPDAKRTFKIDPMCKVSTAKKSVALLKDLEVGDSVTVSYNDVTGIDGKPSRTVTEIAPARGK
jgi:hypothetical protein